MSLALPGWVGRSSVTGEASLVAPIRVGERAEDAGVSLVQTDARTSYFTYGPYELRIQARQASDRYAAFLEPAPEPQPRAPAPEAELVFPEPPAPLPQRTVRVAATHGVAVIRTPWSNLEDGSPELVVQQRWVSGEQYLDSMTEMVIGPWIREVPKDDGTVQLELDESAIRISPPGSSRGPATGSWAVHTAPRFAYWIEPEWTGAMRTERIVVVAASPGVRVEQLKLDRSLAMQDYGRSLVMQLVRLPHPALVPSQGTPIDPNMLVGERPVDDEVTGGFLPQPGSLPPRARAERGFAGNVTIRHGSGATVSVAADAGELSSANGAAFAWQVVTGTATGDEIRIAAGPGTTVAIGEPIPSDMTGSGAVSSIQLRNVTAGRGLDSVGLSVRIVSLPMADLVPLQGTPLNLEYLLGQGGWYREADHHEWLGTNDLPYELSATALDTGLSLIPVFGAFYLAGEFVYGLSTGRDFYGRELSGLDLALLGVGAVMELIPLVGPLIMRAVGATVRAGEAAVRVSAAAARVGMTEQRLEQVMWRLYRVSAVDDAEVVARVTQALNKGRDIPIKDLDRISGLLRRLGANEEALASSRWHGFIRAAEGEGAAGTAWALRAESREWLAALDAETRLRLRTEPGLMHAYESMDPAVRRLLTWCGSACLLGVKPTGSQTSRLRRLIRTGELLEGSLAERQARVFLHGSGKDLEAGIRALERRAGSSKQLQRFLGRTVDDVDVVLLRRRDLARTPAVRAEIRRALNTGLDPLVLGEIMDAAAAGARNSTRLTGYLTKLGRLRRAGVPGVDVVLNDLARGGNWTGGAEWVLHFLETAPGGPLWGKVREFESVMATGLGRREVDVLLKNGTRLQLKSWFDFRARTFVEQIAKDWELAGRKASGFLWVFDKGATVADEGMIRAAAAQALRDASAQGRLRMSAAEMQTLISNLGTLIVLR